MVKFDNNNSNFVYYPFSWIPFLREGANMEEYFVDRELRSWKHEQKLFKIEKKMFANKICTKSNKYVTKGTKDVHKWKLLDVWPCTTYYGFVWPFIVFSGSYGIFWFFMVIYAKMLIWLDLVSSFLIDFRALMLRIRGLILPFLRNMERALIKVFISVCILDSSDISSTNFCEVCQQTKLECVALKYNWLLTVKS